MENMNKNLMEEPEDFSEPEEEITPPIDIQKLQQIKCSNCESVLENLLGLVDSNLILKCTSCLRVNIIRLDSQKNNTTKLVKKEISYLG